MVRYRGGLVGLGTFAAGETHRYQFSVTVDASADNDYQGRNSVVPFSWTAS